MSAKAKVKSPVPPKNEPTVIEPSVKIVYIHSNDSPQLSEAIFKGNKITVPAKSVLFTCDTLSTGEPMYEIADLDYVSVVKKGRGSQKTASLVATPMLESEIASRKSVLSDYEDPVYSHYYTYQEYNYSDCPYGGLHTSHNSSCVYSWNYISSYTLSCEKTTSTPECGLSVHTHSGSSTSGGGCYGSSSTVWSFEKKTTKTCGTYVPFTDQYTNNGSNWNYGYCSKCGNKVIGPTNTYSGTCNKSTTKWVAGTSTTAVSGSNYRNITSTTTYSLNCGKSEHTHATSCYHSHSGSSSSGGGCYGTPVYSTGSNYSNCPYGGLHTSHSESCRHYYTTGSTTYHWEKSPTYSNDVLRYSVKVHGVPADPFSSCGSSSVSLKAPTRKGYTFKGWYGSNGCTIDNPSKTNPSFSATSSGNIEYYAAWKLNTYNATYNLNGGMLPNASYKIGDTIYPIEIPKGMKLKKFTITYTVEDQDLVVLEPIKKGYAFKGWV